MGPRLGFVDSTNQTRLRSVSRGPPQLGVCVTAAANPPLSVVSTRAIESNSRDEEEL
jgi:hypothetical protein